MHLVLQAIRYLHVHEALSWAVSPAWRKCMQQLHAHLDLYTRLAH